MPPAPPLRRLRPRQREAEIPIEKSPQMRAGEGEGGSELRPPRRTATPDCESLRTCHPDTRLAEADDGEDGGGGPGRREPQVVSAYILIQVEVGQAASVAKGVCWDQAGGLAEAVAGPSDVIARAEGPATASANPRSEEHT